MRKKLNSETVVLTLLLALFFLGCTCPLQTDHSGKVVVIANSVATHKNGQVYDYTTAVKLIDCDCTETYVYRSDLPYLKNDTLYVWSGEVVGTVWQNKAK